MREGSFKSGAAVEVNFDEEYVGDVWFPAIVVKDIGNGSFLVECQSSKESGFVKVVVDSLHIRSPPPSLTYKEFQLLEKVDAFYGFSWSSGVVTKVLADGRYIVFFKRTRKEKELNLTDLRLHMDWVDGKWVHPSQVISLTSNSQEQLGGISVDGSNAMVTAPPESSVVQRENVREERLPVIRLRRDQKVKKTRDAEKSPYNSNTTSSKRVKRSRNISTHGNLTVNSEGVTVLETLLSPKASLVNTVEPGRSNSEPMKDSFTPAAVPVGTASVERFEVRSRSSAKLNGSEKMETEHKKTKSSETQYIEGPRKRGRPVGSVVKFPRALAADEADAEGEDNEVAAKPVILALGSSSIKKTANVESTCQLNALDAGITLNDEKNLPDNVHNREVTENREQKDSHSWVPKRRKGRPVKVQYGGLNGSRAANRWNTAGADANPIHLKHETSDEADQLPTVNEVPLAIDGSVPSQIVKLIEDQTNPLSSAHRKNKTSIIFGKRGRRKRKILNGAFVTVLDQPAQAQILPSGQANTELPARDSQDLSHEQATEALANGSAEDAEQSAATNVSDEDKPLSTWFEGIQSSPKLDDSGVLLSRCKDATRNQNQVRAQAGDQSNEETAPKQDVTAASPLETEPRESTAIIPVTEDLLVEDQNLPFLKNSLVWKMIESMEVFRSLPQRPHFLPLYDCKEEIREGLAIGNMVTFASLVEKVAKFRFDDPKCALDSGIETLIELEKHGFNVDVVRARLRVLTAIKSGQEEALNTALKLENQIIDRTLERSRFQDEIADIDKKILELQEKRLSVAAMEERKNSEIDGLQSSVDAINASIEGSRAEFDRIAAAPW
ncbi:hypothetical protein Dimus_016707 [Dionaea muscipula]